MTTRVVIHRDRTFEYMGERYRVDFNSMAELRAWLNEGIQKGWPLGTPMTQTEWAMLNNPPAALPGTDKEN